MAFAERPVSDGFAGVDTRTETLELFESRQTVCEFDPGLSVGHVDMGPGCRNGRVVQGRCRKPRVRSPVLPVDLRFGAVGERGTAVATESALDPRGLLADLDVAPGNQKIIGRDFRPGSERTAQGQLAGPAMTMAGPGGRPLNLVANGTAVASALKNRCFIRHDISFRLMLENLSLRQARVDAGTTTLLVLFLQLPGQQTTIEILPIC